MEELVAKLALAEESSAVPGGNLVTRGLTYLSFGLSSSKDFQCEPRSRKREGFPWLRRQLEKACIGGYLSHGGFASAG